MSLTPSTMLELGTLAPPFSLAGPDGKTYVLNDRAIDKGLIVLFMCNHCPYVIHIREKLVERLHFYQTQGIEVVAINSNDYSNYQDDSPQRMAEDIQQFKYKFPYLVDENQDVAKKYRAACTPDLYLFDREKRLVYRGQFDGARPGNNEPVTGSDLEEAVTCVLQGKEVGFEQRPSMGCNIKWKTGNEPDYFNTQG